MNTNAPYLFSRQFASSSQLISRILVRCAAIFNLRPGRNSDHGDERLVSMPPRKHHFFALSFLSWELGTAYLISPFVRNNNVKKLFDQ